MDQEGVSLEKRIFSTFKTPPTFKPAERLLWEKSEACRHCYDTSAHDLYDAIADRTWEQTPLEIFSEGRLSTVFLRGNAFLYYFPCFLLLLVRHPTSRGYLCAVTNRLLTTKREPWKHENVVLLAKYESDKIAVVVDAVRYAIKHLVDEFDQETKKRAARRLQLFVEGIAYHKTNHPQPLP